MLVHSNRVRAMNLALETGVLQAILPPVVAMKGLFQGKPVQPEGDLWDHTMLVLDLLPCRPCFHARLRRTAARRRQAGDARRCTAAATRSTITSRPVRGSPSGFVEGSSCPMPSASGSPGSLQITSTWERPGNSASRSSSESWPRRDRRAAGPARSRLAGVTRLERGSRLLPAVPRVSAGRRDQSAATDHRPRSGPPRTEAGPAVRGLLEQLRDAQLEGTIHSKREALEWVERQLAADASRGLAASPSDPSTKG